MEHVDYYAVKRAPLEEIKARLQQAKITALIADGVLLKPEHKWVVVGAPRLMGFKVPGDFSTFSVFYDPWEELKKSFRRIFRFFVEEGYRDWSITCGLDGEERSFEFYERTTPYNYTKEDKEYVSVLFELPFEDLVPVLKPGCYEPRMRVVWKFCGLVGLPFLEMEQQDKLACVVPRGTVMFSSELPG
jgi:hypothetical protein